MAEILHHLTCMKPCRSWDKLPINWCRIPAINSTTIKASRITVPGYFHQPPRPWIASRDPVSLMASHATRGSWSRVFFFFFLGRFFHGQESPKSSHVKMSIVKHCWWFRVFFLYLLSLVWFAVFLGRSCLLFYSYFSRLSWCLTVTDNFWQWASGADDGLIHCGPWRFPWAFAWVDRRWHRFSFRDLVAIAGVVIVASHASTQRCSWQGKVSMKDIHKVF